MMGQDRHYLAHEYFNRDWGPMSFSELAQWFAPAKLTYACSAHYLDTHQLRPAPDGGLVGLPRGIHKNFQVWRAGAEVRLCARPFVAAE